MKATGRNGDGMVVAALALLVGAAGCGGPSAPGTPAGGAGERTQSDHFGRAMDFVRRMDEFKPETAVPLVCDQLNQWIESQPPDRQWAADPLIKRLPRELRPMSAPEQLQALRFRAEDVQFLQEARWLQDISQWVSQKPTTDRSWARWLAEAERRLGRSAVQKLTVAERLFDWTVRNVQLEPLLPYPKTPAAGPRAGSGGQEQASALPPQQGVPGPGYRHHPWQVLMYGRGDAWRRARVFILLARQQRLDVVMLAIDEEYTTPRFRPWLPAVLVDDQLYLFDVQLGLPIPGPDGEGVASLEQVLANGGLLRVLDLSARRPYPTTSEHLGKLVALIDASPGYLAQRMKLVESRLAGKQQMVLTTSPSDLEKRLGKCKGIRDIALWTLPYETVLFRAAYDRMIQQDKEAQRIHIKEEGVFTPDNPLLLALDQLVEGRPLERLSETLVRGRCQHFRGAFDSQDDTPGAKSRYLAARLSDEAIQQTEISDRARKQIELERGRDENPAIRQAQFEKLKQMLQELELQCKLHATYWLGLVHYESGNYEAAVDWLQRRTLDASPDGPWTYGARYNLARCYEAMGRLKEAIELLQKDNSPQRHGNQLRARRLQNAPSPRKAT